MGNTSKKLAAKCTLLTKEEQKYVAATFRAASKNSERIREEDLIVSGKLDAVSLENNTLFNLPIELVSYKTTFKVRFHQKDPVPLTPINLDATPARSILKSTKKSGKNTIKVDLFDESDSDITKSNKLNNDSDISGVEEIETDETIDNNKTSEEKGNKKESSRRKSLKSTKKSGKNTIKVVIFDESDSDITESNKLNNDSDISGMEKIETDETIDNNKTSEEKGNKKESSRRKSLKSTKKSGKNTIKVDIFDESDSDITESNKLNNDSDISGVEKIETDETIDNNKTSEEKENKKESSRRKFLKSTKKSGKNTIKFISYHCIIM